MKKHFKWAVPLTDEEMNTILREGIISFDTNVLLDLHRLNMGGMQQLKKAIEYCGDRAWLTNQVAQEYITNYEDVDNAERNFFDDCCRDFDKIEGQGLKILDKSRKNLPTHNTEILDTLTSLESELKNFVATAKEKYLEWGKAQSTGVQAGEITKWIMEFFNGKTGKSFTGAELKTRIDEAKKRFEEKIPPGFEDRKKPEDSRYGDYLIWVQLQEKAKSDRKDMIFVTRDEKKDWYDEIGQGKKRPALALLQEFHDKTEHQRIFIFKPSRFLEKFLPLVQPRPRLSQVTKKAIEEIKKFQENRYPLDGDARFARVPTVSRQYSQIDRFDQRSQSGVIYFTLWRDVMHFRLRIRLHMDYNEEIAIDSRLSGATVSIPPVATTCIPSPHGFATIQLTAKEGDRPFRAGRYRLVYQLEAIGVASDDDMPFPDTSVEW